MSNRTPRPVYDPEYVRDVSEAVYRDRLGADGVERAEDDPKRGAAWLRRNAGAYDTLTRAYLDALNTTGLRAREIKD